MFAKFKDKKLAPLIAISTGLVGVSIGLTLMYLLPTYVVSTLNSTGVFTCSTSVTSAYSGITTIQALGLIVIVISLLWIVIGVISASGSSM